MVYDSYKIPKTKVRDVRDAFKYPCPALLTEEQPSSLRLLTIYPGAGVDPVECLLTSHAWDPETGSISRSEQAESLTYEALSYCWGDEDQLFRTCINDQIFPVTKDLLEALFFLRKNASSRTVWVDAICINQTDRQDKGYQIRQMHNIYKHAQQAVVWLGAPTQNSDLAFKFIGVLYSCFPENAKGGPEGELLDDEGHALTRKSLLQAISHLLHKDRAREWLALSKLLSRPYWGRAWVFQELSMAKAAIFACGWRWTNWGPIELAINVVRGKCIEIQDLINSALPIEDQQTLFPITDQNPYHWSWLYSYWLLGVDEGRRYMKNNTRHAPASETMERWLDIIQTRFCKYEHDKIYSILGLTSPAVSKLVPDPDYSRKAQDVLKQGVRAYVLGTMSLNVLCFSTNADMQRDDLPSWTPDLRGYRRMNSIHAMAGIFGTVSQRSWHSSALAHHLPQFSDDLSTLSVHGTVLGVVRHINIENELLPRLRKTSRLITDHNQYETSTSDHHEEVFLERWEFEDDARDFLGSDANSESPLVGNEEGDTLLSMLLSKRNPSRFKPRRTKGKNERFTARIGNDNFEGIYNYMRYLVNCRTVIETDTLELAIAPSWTQRDDLLCQFIGCTAAVVLRKQKDGTYKFVGDSYVFQKMGQAAISLLEEVLKKPDGVIRFDLV